MQNLKNGLSTSVLIDFKVRVNTIIEERKDWQETVYATANDGLYAMLGKVYDIYTQALEGSNVDALKYGWMVGEAKKREIVVKKSTTFLQLITKLVFSSDCSDNRRVSSYIRVLNAAIQSPEVGVGADIGSFIKKYGGIEEIRASLTKNTKTPKQRAQIGRELALSMQNIGIVDTNETQELAADGADKFVVIVGILNASGSVELKHICYESEVNGVSGKTAVNAALSNLYSKSIKNEKAETARVSEENSIEQSNEIGFETQIKVNEDVIKDTKVA